MAQIGGLFHCVKYLAIIRNDKQVDEVIFFDVLCEPGGIGFFNCPPLRSLDFPFGFFEIQDIAKLDANARLRKELSTEALARRDTFNATASGKANLLGESELVDAISSGRVELDEIEEENLPASLQANAHSTIGPRLLFGAQPQTHLLLHHDDGAAHR